MPSKPIGPGDAAKRVICNIEVLRGVRWHTFADLSARLTAAGRPIFPLGLSRLLRGERRIDVDDLVALAAALDVPVADLLLGEIEIATVVRARRD